MPAWEFETQLNPNQTVTIPPDIFVHLRPDEIVQVVLKTSEGSEESDWQRLATEQFLQGYAPGDDIYDHYPTG